jgi:protein-S-isoprenylcysteine O-methyltransferase Ste14
VIGRASPWWYRRRGTLLAAIYAAGFFFGNLPFNGPAPAYVAWGERFAGGFGSLVLLWTAFACALLAWFWRASGTAYLRRNVVFAADVRCERLIVAGPFRYVRNPLYVGNMFLALALGLLAPPLGFALILVGNAVWVACVAAEEGRELALHYGDAYTAFRAAVPAFVPRLTPATVEGSAAVRPSWRAALAGEAFCLALALAIVPLVLYGVAGLPAFWAIAAAAFVLFAVAGWRAGRTGAS